MDARVPVSGQARGRVDAGCATGDRLSSHPNLRRSADEVEQELPWTWRDDELDVVDGRGVTSRRVVGARLAVRVWSCGRHRNQPVLDGVKRSLGPAQNPKLTQNIADMGFDRLLTDTQFSGDLFVGQAVG